MAQRSYADTHGKGIRAICLTLACFAAQSAHAQSIRESLSLDPPLWDVSGLEIQAGGAAQGALIAQSGGGQKAASGLLTGNLRLRRIFDNGMILGGRGDFLLYRDALAGDNYGGDTVQKLYLYLQTGFGRLDIGQQDGAAASLSLRGPIVDSKINLADRGITLFRDPRTGASLAGVFAPMIGVAASSNYAKVNYTTPRLFGVQAGLSYTPEAVRSPLPFTGNAAGAPNGQSDIVEAALSYTGYFANTAVGVSAAFTHGALKNGTPGFSDLSEWQVGTQIAQTLSSVKLSVGGGYRRTNAYLLNIGQVFTGRETGIAHLAASAEWGSWIVGMEHSLSNAEGPADYRIGGYQLTAAYKLNANLQISAGWQWFGYRRDAGAFHNGLNRLKLDAGFLTLGYTL
jgi:Gram-negative porin